MRRFFVGMHLIDLKIVEALHLHKDMHLCRRVVGWSPFVGAAMMMGHLSALVCGYHWSLANVIGKSSLIVFFLLLCLSVTFGYCWIHRAFLLYNFVVNMVLEIQKIEPFGDVLAPSRWIMLGVGASLFLIYVRYKWIFRYKKKK